MPGRINDSHVGGNNDQGPRYTRSDVVVNGSTEHNNERSTDMGEVGVSQDENEAHLTASDSGNPLDTSGSRSPTPEAPTPEAPTPEAPTPEAPTPEAPTPEAPTPEAPTPGHSTRPRIGSNGSMTDDSTNKSEEENDGHMNTYHMNAYLDEGTESPFNTQRLGRRAAPQPDVFAGAGGPWYNQVPGSAASHTHLANTSPNGGLGNGFVNGDGPNAVIRPDQVVRPIDYYDVELVLDSDSDVAQDDNPSGRAH